MPDEVERELDAAMGKVVADLTTPRPPLRAITPVKPVSLTDQWVKLERIEEELRTRIRREKMLIIAEHDRLWTETKADFERRIDDAVTKLETQRAEALRTLQDQTAVKLREHDLLTERMGRLT